MLLPAQIQENSLLAQLTAPFATTLPAKPTVGNTVLAHVALNTSATGKNASLGGSSNMTNLKEYNGTGVFWHKTYCKTVDASDGATMTYTDATPPANVWLDAWEWANLTTTLDDTVKNNFGTTVTTLASPSITTTQANSLIVCYMWWNGTANTPAVDSGFTVKLLNTRFSVAYLIASAAGTYTPTWTWTTGRTCLLTTYALKARAGLTPEQASRGFLGLMA